MAPLLSVDEKSSSNRTKIHVQDRFFFIPENKTRPGSLYLYESRLCCVQLCIMEEKKPSYCTHRTNLSHARKKPASRILHAHATQLLVLTEIPTSYNLAQDQFTKLRASGQGRLPCRIFFRGKRVCVCVLAFGTFLLLQAGKPPPRLHLGFLIKKQTPPTVTAIKEKKLSLSLSLLPLLLLRWPIQQRDVADVVGLLLCHI